MGNEVPKFQPILDYYLFQKKIKENLNNKNKNEVDNKKKQDILYIQNGLKNGKKRFHMSQHVN